MAEFSRIKVTPAAEEDIVILVGAVEEGAPDATSQAASAEDRFVEEALVTEDEAASTAPDRAAYEETTLEDLRPVGLAGMQKAIIAVAIVAVVAFIIWYVLVR